MTIATISVLSPLKSSMPVLIIVYAKVSQNWSWKICRFSVDGICANKEVVAVKDMP